MRKLITAVIVVLVLFAGAVLAQEVRDDREYYMYDGSASYDGAAAVVLTFPTSVSVRNQCPLG